MNIKFWVLVTKDNQNIVNSIYSPDFNMYLLSYGNLESNCSYRTIASANIKQLIIDYNLRLEPRDIKDLIDIKISELQHWDCIKVDLEPLQAFFTKILPISGIVANFVATATGGATTYMALHINSSNNHDTSNFMETLNIFGATFDSIISLIMYNNSDTNALMSGIGHFLDTKFCNKTNKEQQVAKVDFNYARVATLAIIIITVTLNTLIASIRRYQELNLLVKKFSEINNKSKADSEQEYALYCWTVIYPFILTMAYSGIAFQASFINKQLQKVFNKKSFNHDLATPDTELLLDTEELAQSNPDMHLPRELLFEYRNRTEKYELRHDNTAQRLTFS